MGTFHLAYQVAALAISVAAQVAESKVTEIDTILPAVNGTYAPGENNRFPLVWAVRNPTQWQSGQALLTYTVTPSGKRVIPDTGTFQLNNVNTTDDVYYLTAYTIGEPGNDYNITWYVSGGACNDDARGFDHGAQGRAISSFHFSVKPGGQEADFATAANVSCDDRNALAYKFDVDAEHICREVDNHQLYPQPDPCGLKIADDAAATVQKSLDDKYKRHCHDNPLSPICPVAASTNSTSTDKKNAAAAAQVSAGTLLLGLALSVVAVAGSFLS